MSLPNTDEEVAPNILREHQIPSIETGDPIAADSTMVSVSDTGSVDENLSLNDDLTNTSEYSNGLHIHRAGSVVSRRTSTETESVFLSLGFFQSLYGRNDDSMSNSDLLGRTEEFSPLGPNSIFELTYASDQARQRHNKAPRISVAINGGQTVVANLRVPTTKDIPPIQLLKLKHKVSSTSLESLYDSSVLDAYKSFELSYNNLTEVSLQKLSAQSNEERTKSNDHTSTASTTSNFDTYILDNNNTNNNDEGRKLGMGIPDVYFDPDFRLDNSRIFKRVIENTRILPDENSPNPDEYLVNNTHLQEKISQYLDIVEVELINEISKSSDSFFGTFESIEGMRIKSESCKSKFLSIMEKLNTIKSEQVEKGKKIVENLQKKKEVENLESALLQIKYIQSYFHSAQHSFGQRKFSECLKQVVMVEHLLQGIDKGDCQDPDILDLYPKLPYPMQNLLSLPAFIHLRNDLEMLKKECSISYINDFMHLLVDDLREHCASVTPQDSINRIYLSINKSKKVDHKVINSSYQTISGSTKELLESYIKNLIKSGYLVPAYDSYQDRIITEVKGIIKTYLPSTRMETEGSQSSSRQSPAFEQARAAASGGTSGSLSSNIKALTPREFESMLRMTYAQLSECLRRLTSQQKVLLDLSLSNIPTSSNIDFMSLDISTAISKAVEISQIRLTKIINVRLEHNADLPVNMYLKLYSLTSVFLQECEQISPMSVASSQGSLGEWFKNHIVYFVHKHHLNAMKQLISDTDKETWKEITVPEKLAETQTKIQEIIDYATYIESEHKSGFSGADWLEALNLYDDGKDENTEVAKDTALSSAHDTKLHINDELFVVPRLILQSVNLIRDYLIITKMFSQYTSQVLTQLLNFFKLLNSKVSQAILNAGATRTAGLKHITTKHIALCIQTIEFSILLIPFLSTIFNDVPATPPPNLSTEPLTFDHILSNYKDHENELFSKLVSIMHDRVVSHCNAIVKVDWSQPLKPAVQSKTNKYAQQCHPYMETLVNETNTVTRVLIKYLSEIKYTLILLQIFDDYRRMLVECYCTKLPQFKDFDEKQAVLKDIDYFRVNLCEMPGYGNSGQVIWENVNAMTTIEDEEMERKMRANFENEASTNVEDEKEKEDHLSEPEALPLDSAVDNGSKDDGEEGDGDDDDKNKILNVTVVESTEEPAIDAEKAIDEAANEVSLLKEEEEEEEEEDKEGTSNAKEEVSELKDETTSTPEALNEVSQTQGDDVSDSVVSEAKESDNSEPLAEANEVPKEASSVGEEPDLDTKENGQVSEDATASSSVTGPKTTELVLNDDLEEPQQDTHEEDGQPELDPAEGVKSEQDVDNEDSIANEAGDDKDEQTKEEPVEPVEPVQQTEPESA